MNDVVPAHRQLIENKLLAALEDDTCMAVLVTRFDLELLDKAMWYLTGTGELSEQENERAQTFIDGFREMLEVMPE